MKKLGLLLVFSASFACALFGSACDSPVTSSAHVEQRTARFIAESSNETDRLQINYPRGSRMWNGYLDISMKQKDGEVKTKRIPVSGEVDSDGVPGTITIPSSQVGAADLEFALFYDKDLNLQLVGNNNIPHPRLMQRVK